jgi:hypothetical protein
MESRQEAVDGTSRYRAKIQRRINLKYFFIILLLIVYCNHQGSFLEKNSRAGRKGALGTIIAI